MKSIECVIMAEPTAKGRPRSTVINGHVRNYTPAKTRNAESMIQALIREEVMTKGTFDTGVPLRVDATFYRERPKSLKKSVTMPVTKPDLDNYFKLLADAMNKYIFPDDSQLTTVNIKKRFGTPPRIEVKIREDEEIKEKLEDGELDELNNVQKMHTVNSKQPVNTFDSLANFVQRETLQRVFDWGNEECPHVHYVLSNRPKHACDLCWQELAKEIKELECK